MKKLKITVFTVICALCMALGVSLMTNVNNASAETTTGTTPTLSATRVMISSTKDKMLLATAIKDYGDVYEVGYDFTDEVEPILSENNKYYSSITSGNTTLYPTDIFNEAWVGDSGVGMIIWEIPFSAGITYEYKPYALVGDRNELDELVIPAEEQRITPEDATSRTFYIITAQASDAEFGSVSKASVAVPSGSAISVSDNIITVGGINITATKNTDNPQYTYGYAATVWTVAEGEFPEMVNGNITITANFTRTLNQYTVTFKNYDGTVLQSGSVDYGTVPVYSGEAPTMASDAQYTYGAFTGWDSEIIAVSGDTVYTATYNNMAVNQYTLTFDMDGGALSDGEDDNITSLTLDYGTPASDLDDLIKSKTGYSFNGWRYSVDGGETYEELIGTETVQCDLTLKATWTIDYTMSLDSNSASIYKDNVAGGAANPKSFAFTKTIVPSLSVTPAETVDFSYESDNTDVATVSDAGVITPIAAGSATITVTATDSSTGETLTATFTVSVANYYEVGDKTALANISADPAGYYLLTANISLSGETWAPDYTFTGIFDGNEKTISDLATQGANGFFKDVNGAKIMNVIFKDIALAGNSGGMCYRPTGGLTVENTVIHIKSTVNSGRYGAICERSNNSVALNLTDVIIKMPGTYANESVYGYILKGTSRWTNVTVIGFADSVNGSGYHFRIGNSGAQIHAESTYAFYADFNAFLNADTTANTFCKAGINDCLNLVTISQTNISDLLTLNGNEYVLITENLNASGITWNPSYTFTGTFDGNGHTISNITLPTYDATNAPDNMYAVFKTLNGTVKNVAFTNLSKGHTSLIANTVSATATLENVFIHYSAKTFDARAVLFETVTGAVNMTNVIVYDAVDDLARTALLSGATSGMSNPCTLTNVYCIGSKLKAMTDANKFTARATKASTNVTKTNLQTFNTVSDFNTAANAEESTVVLTTFLQNCVDNILNA